MEQAKKRIRICLICVVTAAVLLGILYYVLTQRQPVSEENGTLVMEQVVEGESDVWSDLIY